jgi:hypothetical protein
MRRLVRVLKLFSLRRFLVPHVVAQFQRAQGVAAYRYIRLNAADAYGGATHLQIFEFQARESAGDASSYLTGGTASASSTGAGGGAPSAAFDGIISSFWLNADSAFPAWLKYALASGNTKYPRVLSLCVNPGPNNCTLEASNNGTDWTVLKTIAPGDVYMYANANAYWHFAMAGVEVWRVRISAVQGGGTQTFVSSIELRGSIGGANLLVGGLPTAQSFNTFLPHYVNDGNNSTYWQNNIANPIGSGNSSWWSYILPYGVSIAHIAELYLRGGNTVNNPVDLVVEKSTDGCVTWETVKSHTGVYFSGEGGLESRTLYDAIAADTTKIKFLTHADGNNGDTAIVDQKGHAFTRTGTATLSSAQKVSGSASMAILGGTNSGWKSTHLEADFAISGTYYADVFTLEFWVYPTNTTGSTQYLLALFGDTSQLVYFTLNISGVMAVSGFGSSVSFVAPAPSLNVNQWNHVAACSDGAVWYLCLNGKTCKGSNVGSSSTHFMNTARLFLGRYGVDGYGTLQGYVDEVRLIKGQCLYPGNYTPPTPPFADP